MRAQNTSSISLFYKKMGVTWRVSDCEELVWGQPQEMVGLGFLVFQSYL